MKLEIKIKKEILKVLLTFDLEKSEELSFANRPVQI